MTEWQADRIIALLESIDAKLERWAMPDAWLVQDPESGETHMEAIRVSR